MNQVLLLLKVIKGEEEMKFTYTQLAIIKEVEENMCDILFNNLKDKGLEIPLLTSINLSLARDIRYERAVEEFFNNKLFF
jgi:hypothetical protein